VGDVRRLAVYTKAVVLADEARAAALGWDSFDRWTLGVQVVRAADSIGANLAEAFGRETDRDRLRLLIIARGSATETEHWLERAVARELVGGELVERAGEICRMLNGLIASNRP
jgi:four helix bundle protein